MKPRTFLSCWMSGCWVLACGSEPPSGDPPDPSAPDDVVVIATAEAVMSTAAAATNGAGGASAGSASTPENTSDQSGAATSAATDGSSVGGATPSDGAATGAGTAGTSGAAGASSRTDTDTDTDTASTNAGAVGGSTGSGGSADSGSGDPSSSTGEPPPPSVPLGAVLITEYVEGADGDDKAIELSNVSDEPLSLAGCRLETYFNGNLESTSGVDLAVLLGPQHSYVLCKSTASAVLLPACDQTAASINFNGDDALVLRCNGVVHDSFGQVGFDPGDAWQSSDGQGTETTGGEPGADAYATADHVLRRSCETLARTDPAAPFEGALTEAWVNVWQFDGRTTPSLAFEGLGSAACADRSASGDSGSGSGAGGAASD